jgi:hypothetical protein
LLIETPGRPTAAPIFLLGDMLTCDSPSAASGPRDHASFPNTWLSTHGCERSDNAARSGPQEAAAFHRNPTAKIIAAALGLFLGLFILWAVVADNPSGVGSMAVVPADLHIAKKGPQIIDVPQGVPREPRRSIQATSWLRANAVSATGKPIALRATRGS